MIRMFKAELLKLRRRRVAIAVAISALAFAAIAPTAVFLSATAAGEPGSQRGATVESLGQAGGATEAFSIGVSFAGILVLVLFIANVAGEFSQGTFRTLLMRQPRRVALLAGKMAALLVFAAGVLALAEVLTVGRVGRDRSDAGRLDRRRGSASTGSARPPATTRRPCSASRRGRRSAWRSRSSCARSRSRWPSGSCGRARSSTCSRTRGAAAEPVVPGPAAGGARRRRHGRRLRDPGADARRALRHRGRDRRRDRVRDAATSRRERGLSSAG